MPGAAYYHHAALTNFPNEFEAVVARCPGRCAISVRGERGVERLTYRDLDRLAARVAAFLAEKGVTAGDRCAILAENSARWVASYLGILRLGAIAVPFDTAYSPEQVARLLRDSGARVLFTSPRFEAAARAAAGDCCVVPFDAALDSTASLNERCPASAGDPAVILYTSGTTADPKGVVLTHANLLAEKDGAFQIVPVSEADVILGVLPLFHALAQMANLLLPFLLGAHVVFLEALNTRELLRALDEEGVTVFVCVPQFFYLIHQRVTGEIAARGAVARRLFRLLLRGNGALRRVGLNAGPWLFRRVHAALGRRMRLLVTGGSKFDDAIGRDLYDLGFTILQAYGLTETSGAATVTRPGEPIHTVGRPLPGVEIRILDGEILIRGPIVMAGYWNNPAATAEVLRGGWLHTGDLGSLDAEGRLTITGRSKEVIVLSSGKNIYPEEIESHYRRSPFVKELCVLGISAAGAPASERLHAVIVPDLDVLRERKIVNTTELIRFELEGLSVSLPPHKRVLGFDVTLDPLPRTTTGKVKRHEVLTRWRARASCAADVAEAPAGADPLEPHVARVVEVVREVVRPGVAVRSDSNLELDLGLDSMERVELLALLERRFGMRVPEEVAHSAFLVRDLARAFPADAEAAVHAGNGAELPWAALLEMPEPGPALRALLAKRRLVAPLLFVIARVASRVLARPAVAGLEHLPAAGPFIISPNHQSYLDPFVLVGVLPFRVFRELFFVGAAEYFQTPLTAWLARNLNVVPVDPDANLVSAMRAGAFGLRHGKVLILFPEGERSIDGTVKKFRKGAAILSQHLAAPVVPVAIDGVFEMWPRNRPLDWRVLLPWSGHRARLAFGAPIHPNGATYAAQTEALRRRVEDMWAALHEQTKRGGPGTAIVDAGEPPPGG